MQPSPSKKLYAFKPSPRTFVSTAPSCPRCDKSVYAAEQVLGPGGREYHKPCLLCVSCKKTVGPGSFEEHEGDPYCKHCYSKTFGPKGYGHGGAMTGEYHDPLLALSSRNSGSPYGSPARTAAQTHRTSNSLSSMRPPDSPSRSGSSAVDRILRRGSSDQDDDDLDDDLRHIPTSRDSPVQVVPSNSAQSTADRTAQIASSEKRSIESPLSLFDRAQHEQQESASRDGGQEAEYEQVQKSVNTVDSVTSAMGSASISRPTSQRPSSPLKQETTPGLAARRPLPVPPPKPAFMSQAASAAPPPPPRSISPTSSVGSGSTAPYSASGSGSSSSHPPAPRTGVGINSNLGIIGAAGPDMCKRCGTTVYFAEKIVAGGHKWHKRCLRCATCSRALDSHMLERENLPYCKKCYDEQFGVRAAGYVLRPALH